MASLLDWIFGSGESAATIQVEGHPRAGIIGWTPPTKAGVPVDEGTALNLSACWCATRVICEAESRIPFQVYKRLPSGGKERMPEHPVARVLRGMANGSQTAMTFREVMTERALNAGVAYAEIERSGAGDVLGLHPIHPSRVRKDAGVFKVQTTKGTVEIAPADMFVLTGPLGGKGVIPYGRESIGSALAAEEYGQAYFGNSAVPPVVLKHTGVLGDTARANLRKEWNELHAGAKNAGNVGLLMEGVEVQALTINNEQAQYLETRLFNVSEIARWYNVTPHKLHDLSRSTYSNVEHLQIAFVSDSMLPWLVRWEAAVNTQLLGDDDTIYAEHLIDGLLRGDAATRSTVYSSGLQNGWMSINEVRAKENLNGIGASGDEHRVQLNLGPVGQAPVVEFNASGFEEILRRLGDGRADDSAVRAVEGLEVSLPRLVAQEVGKLEHKLTPKRNPHLVAAVEGILSETMARLLTKETNAASRAAEKPGEFFAWLDDFYSSHEGLLADALEGPIRAYLLATDDPRSPSRVAKMAAQTHCAASHAALLAAADGKPEAFAERVERLCDGWRRTRKVELGE